MKKLDFDYIDALVRRMRSGDSTAFGQVFAQTYEDLYSFAYGYLENEEMAQKALEDTYVQAIRDNQSTRSHGIFISYLRLLCFKTCFNILHSDVTSILVDGVYVPLDKIYSLPFLQSRIVILFCCDNFSAEKIAELLGMSASVVRQNLALGIETLK